MLVSCSLVGSNCHNLHVKQHLRVHLSQEKKENIELTLPRKDFTLPQVILMTRRKDAIYWGNKMTDVFKGLY